MQTQKVFLPGTVFEVNDAAAEGGHAFFNKVFYVSDTIMLSHLREITGLDAMALQNWVKRKWVPNPVRKYYTREHLARFLIINMLRETMQFTRIFYLLRYLNGTEPQDRVIGEEDLYDLVCRAFGRLIGPDSPGISGLDGVVGELTKDFDGPVTRLNTTLYIMVSAVYAAWVKAGADRMLDRLGAPPDHQTARHREEKKRGSDS